MNPIAFKIGSIEVAWYGVLIAIGVFAAIIFAQRISKEDPNLYEDVVIDFAIFGVPIGIVGARLYYVIFEWEYYSQNPSKIFAIREGGLAIYGGIIAGLIVAIVFCKIKKISFWSFTDALAPGVVLAQGIGRWGNYINQEAHGTPTNLPWGIEIDGVKVHPTFLYESLWDVAIFLFLYLYLVKHKKFKGQVFVAYLILYGIGRYFIEGMRTDSLYIGPLRVSQIVSIIAVVVGIILYFVLQKKTSTDQNPL